MIPSDLISSLKKSSSVSLYKGDICLFISCPEKGLASLVDLHLDHIKMVYVGSDGYLDGLPSNFRWLFSGIPRGRDLTELVKSRAIGMFPRGARIIGFWDWTKGGFPENRSVPQICALLGQSDGVYKDGPVTYATPEFLHKNTEAFVD